MAWEDIKNRIYSIGQTLNRIVTPFEPKEQSFVSPLPTQTQPKIQDYLQMIQRILPSYQQKIPEGQTPADRMREKFQRIISGGVTTEPIATTQPTATPTPTQRNTFGRVTYYLPTGNLTATGTVPTPNYTAAISRELKKLVPMGSIIELPDGKRFRIEDLTAEADKLGKPILNTLDLFREQPEPGEGLRTNVPYRIIGRDISGMKYNY